MGMWPLRTEMGTSAFWRDAQMLGDRAMFGHMWVSTREAEAGTQTDPQKGSDSHPVHPHMLTHPHALAPALGLTAGHARSLCAGGG